MPRFAANVSTLFTELPFSARFGAAARAGFAAVEMQWPEAGDASELSASLTAAGLELVLMNADAGDRTRRGERGIAAIPGREAEFERGFLDSLALAARLECPRLHVMAGLRHQGAERRTFVRNMRHAAAIARASGVTLLIEPINQRDLPGYLVSRTDDALALMALIDEDNVRLQLDLYHRQITEGDLLSVIREVIELVDHVQIAQPPDRGEPDRGEIDFFTVLAALDEAGYTGWIGCEYRPRNTTLDGLGWLAAWARPPGTIRTALKKPRS